MRAQWRRVDGVAMRFAKTKVFMKSGVCWWHFVLVFLLLLFTQLDAAMYVSRAVL